MTPTTAKWLLAIAVAAILPLALALSGVTRLLGAHPLWAVQTAVTGLVIGLAAGLILIRVPAFWRGIAGLALLAASGGAVFHGKAQFAASYAEDALAGRLWYFGWIGVAAGLAFATLAVLAPGNR